MKHLLASFCLIVICSSQAHCQENAEFVADFIRKNPERSSIYYVQNGKVLADINSGRRSPLASTVKIIVAIEYATQVAEGKIFPAKLVDTAELNKYYLPGTDGGAQEQWLFLMDKKRQFKNGKVTLEEVAKGMINFSSNANTEYLLDLLGLDNVNAQLQKLGFKEHDSIYYFTAALGVINGRSQFQLEQMNMKEYRDMAAREHQKLKNDKEYKSTITMLPMFAQKVWSDRLPGSTPYEYAMLMQKLNSRSYFDKKVQENLNKIMEAVMQVPPNTLWLKHAGMKGGSTAWVLTKALYATTTQEETTELAYFFNNLSMVENQKLQQSLNKFEITLIRNTNDSRSEIVKLLQTK
ncbi:MAG: serine hydrolase [Chitinophagales bacterium]|nr:serine hydrolase [Chitinophagales bacterium]